MKKIITGAALSALTLPFIAFAQTTVFSLLGVVKNILDILIPLLITAALVYFIYGVVKYVISSDADDKEKARAVVTRGILGLFIIVSIWGIIGIIQSTGGFGAGGTITKEQIPGVGF